jgi:hypothetical protein
MCAKNGMAGRLDGRPALPAPAGWTGQHFSLAFRLSVGFLTIMALGVAAEAAWAFGTGRPGPGVLLAAGATVIGHVAGLGIFVWRAPRRSGRTGRLEPGPVGTTGVRFAYSAWAYYWLTAFLVFTELGALLVILTAAASATVVGWLLVVALAAAVVAIGWFLVTVLRLAPGELTLSPAGVYHRSLTFTHFAPWRDIFDVTSAWVGTPVIVVKAYPSEETRIRRYTSRFGTREMRFMPFMAVRAYWLAADPIIVYHALSFYQARPDLRPELATPGALQRIDNGRAVARQAP